MINDNSNENYECKYTEEEIAVLDELYEMNYKKLSEEDLEKALKGASKKQNFLKLIKHYTGEEKTKTKFGGGVRVDMSFYEAIAEKKFNPKLRKNIPKYINNIRMLNYLARCGGTCGTYVAGGFRREFIDKIFDKLFINGENFDKESVINWYDYSCGWGERILWALYGGKEGLKVNYYGSDPNRPVMEKLESMRDKYWEVAGKKFDDQEAVIYISGSEERHEELKEKIDISFTSPPYFDLEIYAEDNSQSIYDSASGEALSFEEWVSGYVRATLENCYYYAKPGGWLVINITNSNLVKKDMESAWVEEAKRAGWKFIENEKQYQSSHRLNGATKTKFENFFIFRKIYN